MLNLFKTESRYAGKNNLLRVIKLTAIYTFIGFLLQVVLVNLLLASVPTEAQNLKVVKVKMNVVDVTLEQAFHLIEQKTNFKFCYSKEEIPLNEKATVIVDDESLYNILEVFAKDYSLTFNRINDQIVVKKREANNESLITVADGGTIKGKVVDSVTKEALIGASVSLLGTTLGCYTDSKGYFEIDNIKPGKYTVAASYVGYSTATKIVEIFSDKNTGINFSLETSLVNFDEVTVTGTLSARELRSYPVTIAEIKGVELQNRNINNIATILETIPGIVTAPGTEGANSRSSRLPYALYIRGSSADIPIKYLVDGVEIVADKESRSILETIDPNSIEKIEVLKGPMASSLYGNGGANGIISITTKKGKEGKTRINFKTMYTQYANDYAESSGYSHDYSLNVSGGGEQFNYLFGVGYNLYPLTKLTDLNNGIDNKRWSYNAKISGKMNDIAADLTLQYGKETSGYGTTIPSLNRFMESLGLPTQTVSPISDIRYFQKSFFAGLHLVHTIANNWYHDITLGYNSLNYLSSNYTASRDGSYSNSELLYSKINVRYFMFYDHDWYKDLKSSITAGFEYAGYETHNTGLSLKTPLRDFFTATTKSEGSYQNNPYSSTGYFTEVVTGFKNNLFLTAGIRFDVNDAYGDNVNSYPQPRVGLSYVIEAGDFNIKPRAVWGVSSDPPNPTYKIDYTISYSSATQVYIGNPDIKPQRSEGYELGADIFYGKNYALNITYYDQRIKDLIRSSFTYDLTTTPRTYYYYRYNIAGVINRGLEVSGKALLGPFILSLSYTHIESKWDNIGQKPTETVYSGAPLSNIPKRTFFAQLSYLIPSLLPWTEKGGRVSLDWRYVGGDYGYDGVKYYAACAAWENLPDPKPEEPNIYDYYVWLDGYSYFNMRMDYSVTNFASFYVDIQNLLDLQGSANNQMIVPYSGRRINFGLNFTF